MNFMPFVRHGLPVFDGCSASFAQHFLHRLDLRLLGIGYRFRQLPDLRAVRTLQNGLGHRYGSLVVRDHC